MIYESASLIYRDSSFPSKVFIFSKITSILDILMASKGERIICLILIFVHFCLIIKLKIGLP